MAQKRINEMKSKMVEVERDKKSVEAALDNAKRLRAKGCSSVRPRINWPPPKDRSSPLKRSWRRLRRQGNKQRRLGTTPSRKGMM